MILKSQPAICWIISANSLTSLTPPTKPEREQSIFPIYHNCRLDSTSNLLQVVLKNLTTLHHIFLFSDDSKKPRNVETD